jgi:hypothetical protein
MLSRNKGTLWYVRWRKSGRYGDLQISSYDGMLQCVLFLSVEIFIYSQG